MKRIYQKRHHSERYRSPHLIVERWPNSKVAFVAFLLARGKTLAEICRELDDGTSRYTLLCVMRKWNLPEERPKGGFFQVRLTPHKRALALKQAAKLGIEPEEYLKRIAESVISDDLYNAVTDGRYD